MYALQRFEAWLANLLEGGLAGLLGAEIQPVEIAKRLAEHMEDRRIISAGHKYAPNRFRVYLAPNTLAGFSSFQSALHDELAAFVQARARELDLSFVGRVRVACLADPALGKGRMRIESDVIDRQGQVWERAAQSTEAIDVVGPTTERGADLMLDLGSRRVRLSAAAGASLGRALDNDVIVAEPSVSRHHARLACRAGAWTVEDVGSTRGTYVNGRRVTWAFIRPGDEVRLGNVPLRVLHDDRSAHPPTAGRGSDGSGRRDSRRSAK